MGKKMIVEVSGKKEMDILKELIEIYMQSAHSYPETRFYIRLENLPETVPGKKPPALMCEPWGHAVSGQEKAMIEALAGRKEAEDGKS